MLGRRQFTKVGIAVAAAPALRAGTPGMAAPSVSGIDSVLREGIAKRKIPAVVGMAASAEKVLYSGAFGVRDTSGAAVKVDSIFGIASMTKAITTTAALQLVEQGKVELDGPVSKYLPQLANLQVLTAEGLRPAKTQVTLKHLLTHTSGFCYDTWVGDMYRYTSRPGYKASADHVTPLMYEPGSRWQYGQGIDWAGRLVEKVSGMSLEDYFQKNILGPLGMNDTSYILKPEKFDRLVSMWQRQPGGALKQDERKLPAPPKEFNGGGGLYSTAGDYVKFMQAILRQGQGILKPATVAAMSTNQIGALTAGKMKSFRPDTSSDVDIQPGATEKWGLGFLINTTAYEGGRSAGSLAWAGIANTYYWIDPKRSHCGVIMMQYLPFVDKEAVGLLGDFERAVYKNV